MAALDPAVAHLLTTVAQALHGIPDWRVVATCSAVNRVLAGQDDPGAAADWLREFLNERAAGQATKAGGDA